MRNIYIMPLRKYNKTFKKNKTKARKRKFSKFQKTYKRGGKRTLSQMFDNLKLYVTDPKLRETMRKIKEKKDMLKLRMEEEQNTIELFYLLQFFNKVIDETKFNSYTNNFYNDDYGNVDNDLIKNILKDAGLIDDNSSTNTEEQDNLKNKYENIMASRKQVVSAT